MMTSDVGAAPVRQLTLCFHGIGLPGRPLEPGEERFWLDAGQFTEILSAVRDHPRPVRLTFDDANESDVTTALPALASLGLHAEFYLIARRIGTTGSLSGEQVTGLAAAGMGIGTHGMTHRSWRELRTQSEFDAELTGSARVLEELTGNPVRQAACPRGQYDRRVLGALRKRGFTRVYTVDGETSKPSAWLQSRYTVIRDDSPESIQAHLDAPDPSVQHRIVTRARETVKRWR